MLCDYYDAEFYSNEAFTDLNSDDKDVEENLGV